MIFRRMLPFSFLLQLLVVPTVITVTTGLSSSASPSQCAVVGCGVLGTSLCKQLLATPEFEGWTGKHEISRRLPFSNTVTSSYRSLTGSALTILYYCFYFFRFK
jgi:hypothetical protein